MEDKSTLKDNTPEKELISWDAPERPFKRRNRDFYVTLLAMAFIVGLVLFLVEGWAPVILIIALVFLFYVMSTVEPNNIHYRITNKGVYVSNKMTKLGDMGRFWFSRRFDNELLIMETPNFPGRMELVIPAEIKDQIMKILSEYLSHEEVPPSAMDKAANWFGSKLPRQETQK